MKRGLEDNAVKEQLGEDRIHVPKAKPLQPEEIELLEIHRTLTQHWRNNATNEAREEFLKLGLPTVQRGLSSDSVSDDLDLATQYSRLLDIAEQALFPDELLQAEFTTSAVAEQMLPGTSDLKSSMHKIDEVMEREAKYVTSDDQHADDKRNDSYMDFENTLFPEHEDNLVGDYEYTFCEEEDAY